MLCPSAAGCSRTHFAVTLGDWSDPLDPDAEAQMVYRQLLLGRDQLRWVPRPSHVTHPPWPPPSLQSFFPLTSPEPMGQGLKARTGKHPWVGPNADLDLGIF